MSNIKFSAEEYTQRLKNTFVSFNNALQQIRLDEKISQSEVVVHIADFNIIYPWAWEKFMINKKRRQAPNDAYYDFVGHSIVDLHSKYKAVDGYVMGFTADTFSELIESFAHQYEYAERVLSNKNTSSKLHAQLMRRAQNLTDYLSEGIVDYREHIQYILAHVPLGEVRDAASRVMSLMESNTFVPLSTLVGEDLILEAKNRAQGDVSLYLDRMRNKRSTRDRRDGDHADYHYRVDAAALAVCKNINEISDRYKTNYVCRDIVSSVVDRDDVLSATRSPLTPYLKDVFLFQASADGDVRNEARDIRLEMEEQLSLRLRVIEKIDRMDELTKQRQAYIQEFIEKYIRSNVTSFKEAKNEMEKDRQRVDRIVSSRKHFMEQIDEVRDEAQRASKQIIDLQPEILESRLMEGTDLRENPHAVKIFAKLGIDI
ncbi:MAG: hypothetical protein NPIRA05_19420 [Nitrospirales bacterium]|nr:MAG: hypothetical protein NPIRA05_19420 [Nitrospirales bacterium]